MYPEVKSCVKCGGLQIAILSRAGVRVDNLEGSQPSRPAQCDPNSTGKDHPREW